MEPVSVTGKVRRTVRVAVALVVGQALLGALIGWLTLSQPAPAGNGRDSSAVDRLAAPPPMAPGPPAPGAASPVPASSSAPAQRNRTAAAVQQPPAPPRRSPTGTPPPPSPEPIGLPPEAAPEPPPAPASPAPTSPALTSPSHTAPPATPPPAQPSPPPTTVATTLPPGRIQEPVTIGDLCRPEGSFGRTGEGALVRCAAERQRRPRWKIV